MELNDFQDIIRSKEPAIVTTAFLNSPTIFACDSDKYASFCTRVETTFEDVASVKIMGSGNWRYSLDPENMFREFNDKSDIDTVVISSILFNRTWEELRVYHRSRWYRLTPEQKISLRRNGENVYSGFVSPEWIPDKSNRFRFEFLRTCNRLAAEFEGRDVNMMFFKNTDEVIDYYKRGVIIAKRRLLKNGV